MQRAPSAGRQPEILVELLADIEHLVCCESPSADLAAVAASAEVVATVGTRRLGVEPEFLVERGCTHLRWRFGAAPSRVLLLGHHDTVWPRGSLTTHPFSVRDGILRGPGCFDMKTGLALAIHAVAWLGAPAGVTLLVTGDEEIGSASSRALIEAEAADCAAVLVLEPSADGGALKVARKGIAMYEMRIFGRAAHAGLEPERGVNAALEAAHQLLAVSMLADPTRGTTVTPTLLTGGTTSNTVPAEARFAVDVRVTGADEQQRVDAGLRALTPQLPGARLELSGGVNRPPLPESASAELFARAALVARDRALPAPLAARVGGGSDGNFTAALGVPTLDGLGAVGGGAHADDEHVLVRELPDRLALLGGLLDGLLRDPSARGGREVVPNGEHA
jgi:glutamate carboxypeptidase